MRITGKRLSNQGFLAVSVQMLLVEQGDIPEWCLVPVDSARHDLMACGTDEVNAEINERRWQSYLIDHIIGEAILVRQ